jgi:hypothetical protein
VTSAEVLPVSGGGAAMAALGLALLLLGGLTQRARRTT